MIFDDSLRLTIEKQLHGVVLPRTDISLPFLVHLAEATLEIWQKLGSTSSDSFTTTDSENNFGEMTKDIDIYAKDILAKRITDASAKPITLVTEEDVTTQYPNTVSQILFVDPIDGSSHVEYQSTCGTFFSLTTLDKPSNAYIPAISGYALYGHKLVLAIALGEQLILTSYDQDRKLFYMPNDSHSLPLRGNIYSVCDADSDDFPDYVHSYINGLRNDRYKSRYNGVLVADLHRIIMQGGIFLSPRLKSGKTKTKKYFEAIAIGHIMRAAGGAIAHTYNVAADILRDENKQELFSSVPLVFGSVKEVDAYNDGARSE